MQQRGRSACTPERIDTPGLKLRLPHVGCRFDSQRTDLFKRATRRREITLNQRRKNKTPQSLDSAGFSLPLLAETEGFEPSIQVLAQMLP